MRGGDSTTRQLYHMYFENVFEKNVATYSGVQSFKLIKEHKNIAAYASTYQNYLFFPSKLEIKGASRKEELISQ